MVRLMPSRKESYLQNQSKAAIRMKESPDSPDSPSRPGSPSSSARPDGSAPILFFDSGIGGLSILRATRRLLPRAPFVYAADYAGFPYGTRTQEEIAGHVPALLQRLTEYCRPRLAVIACNTASTIALAHARVSLDLPIVGAVPAVKRAAAMTRSGVIGVLGTVATVRQAYVDTLSSDFAAHCTVLRHGAGELVALAEAKFRRENVPLADVEKALAGLTKQKSADKMDVIVLACTHFPLIEAELRAVLGPTTKIAFIDGASGIARRIAHLTAGQAWSHSSDYPPPAKAIFTHSTILTPPSHEALAEFGIATIEYI